MKLKDIGLWSRLRKKSDILLITQSFYLILCKYYVCNMVHSIYNKREHNIKYNIYYVLINNLKHNAKSNDELILIVLNIILYVRIEIIEMVIIYAILSKLGEMMSVGIRRMKRISGVGEWVIV